MRIRALIVFVLVCVAVQAEVNLTVSKGNAMMLPNPTGVDYVFVFENLTDAEMHTTDSNPDWFEVDGSTETSVSKGTDFFDLDYVDPKNAKCYKLKTDAGETTFCIIDYSAYRLQLDDMLVNLSYDESCNETLLLLDAYIPQISYVTPAGQTVKLTRQAEVEYTSLGWIDEQWQDSICKDTVVLYANTAKAVQTLTVGAPLRNTVFVLRADQYATELNIMPDTIVTPEFIACAVAAHPTTITTVRGTDAENTRTNEIERPIEESQLSGSAPLDIYFKANPTPTATHTQWRLLQANDLIVQRTETEHRYTFDEFGEYVAKVVVSNEKCSSDTMQVQISVATSKLLVPNVFTPNGDNLNDEFRVVYESIVEYEIWVYNRWGKLVYHSTDPAKGWDGNINNRPAAAGAYFYIIRAKGADAEAGAKYRKTTKRHPAEVGIYQLSGDINLIR